MEWRAPVVPLVTASSRLSVRRLREGIGALAATALLAGALATTGCASVTEAVKGEAPAASVLDVEINAPSEVQRLLRTHLDVARVNRLAAGRPVSAVEIERLVEAAPQQARDLLETEGYFEAVVDVRSVPGTPPRVVVDVDCGPRTQIASVDLDLSPPPSDRREVQALQAVRESWTLKPGEPYRAGEWTSAKRLALTRLRGEGYVGADWAATEALIDAAARAARLTATAAIGPLYLTGPLRIEGLKHQDARTVRNLADFDPGEPATEKLLLDFQERLQKSALFNRATVTLEPDAAAPGSTPVVVQLTERELQDATVGLGIAADIGAVVSVEHNHRRPFGRPWISHEKVSLSQREQLFEGEISTQTLPGLWRNVAGAFLRRVTSDTDRVVSLRLRAGRGQETARISRLYLAELERSETRSSAGVQRTDALSAHAHWVFRRLDDRVLPTQGHVWTAEVGAGYATSSPGEHGPFARLRAKYDVFRPWGAWQLQGRVELGQVFVQDGVAAPESMRFRAGGDGSVRGYGYRSLTPRVDGVDVSGNVIFTASAEASHPLTPRIPALAGAVFVDAGRAAARWSELDPAVGVGVGLRYRSPVGPVKLDLAYGLEERQVRLHLTVGVTF